MPVSASNEAVRLTALHRLQLLDTPPEPAFDRLVELARTLFEVPIALISLIDADRQWFKARCGLAANETSRDLAFCNFTILHDTVFVVPDATRDPAFAGNALVTGEPHIRFYAGAPLITEPGIRLGSFCIIDTKPRQLEAADIRNLVSLAQATLSEIWLRSLLEGRSGLGSAPGSAPCAPAMSFGHRQVLAGAQIRAARGLLNWTINQLSEASQVSVNAIKRLEAGGGSLSMRTSTADKIVDTFESRGVVFTGRSASTAGVAYSGRQPRL
ncbi:GAF domain-containing protein [Methylobacterium radiodurans]|uniref:Diguanylate cyclase n=1 Tax=Methylobacterium radiodurans TaxID=2202828 RepID=A0A2U8VWH1_9HYPH|nr:GAF domain-containing protein [Methylobacterium radiodurans]AWN37778.1 diguanylate cyclase [Methylobacterium radiodurans]